MKQCALTTKDNPFDPFEDFKSWFQFDVEKGYNCCSILDRIADIKDEMTLIERLKETERAIDEIIKYDFLKIYKKKEKEITLPQD